MNGSRPESIPTEDVGVPEVTLAAYDGRFISPGSPCHCNYGLGRGGARARGSAVMP